MLHKGVTPIYLDNNAGSPLRPCAKDALFTHASQIGNASSSHFLGQQQHQILASARSRALEVLEARDKRLIFTSGCTESNTLALFGMDPFIEHMIIGAAEHDSVSKNAPLASCRSHKKALHTIPLTPKGKLDIDALEEILARITKPFLVSVAAANHETGVINDIPHIARKVHHKGGFLHTDAAQFLGKSTYEPSFLKDADLVSCSSHKTGGPQGVGALLIKQNMPFTPPFGGGGQEEGVRSGTVPIALVAGFTSALEEALGNASHAHLLNLKAWFAHMERTIKHTAPKAVIWGAKASRLVQTTSIYMPFVPRETQLMHFDINNIAVGVGSACRSGLKEPSPTLRAMGAGEKKAQNSIRVSGGWQTKEQDLKLFTQAWIDLYKRTHNNTPERSAA